MPTPPVDADRMTPGGSGGGKHWTLAEVESRQAAAGQTRRRTRVTLKPPDWLSADALAVWKSVKKKLKDIELLDNLDTDLLAIYCDAVAQYQAASKELRIPPGDEGYITPLVREDRTKQCQAWARIVSQYAEKLGLSPAGRARLAKRKAEPFADPFAEQFGG